MAPRLEPRATGGALVIHSRGPDDTREVGRALGRVIEPGDVVRLEGTFGVGKTTLTQGIARGLAIDDDVTSPSFALVNEYVVPPSHRRPGRLVHLDLYRLSGDVDAESIGIDEYLDPTSVIVVEWGERAERTLPSPTITIVLEDDGADRRQLRITAGDDDLLNRLANALTSGQVDAARD